MNNKEGATLVEILIVLAVLIITAAGGVVWRGRSSSPPTPTPESALPVMPDEDIPNSLLPTARTLTGTWKLIAYKNLITGEIETEPEDIWKSIIIEFIDDGKRGKLQGHTINNSVRGDYEISSGNKIKVLRFGGSKAGEGWSWGYKFWDAVRQSSSYQIKGNSLFLYFNSDKELMEFVKQ